MIAGGVDDDRLAAALVASLRQRGAALRIVGIAGPRMREQGVEAVVPIETLSLREDKIVLGRAGMHREIGRSMLEAEPGLVVDVGASEFNLARARHLRRAGVPTVQYAGPAVWTWRNWRVKRLACCLSHVLALFPFESTAYERAGIAATYVGHPLADSVPLDIDKSAARTQLRLPHGKLIVALIPHEHADGPQPIAEVYIKAARRFHSEVKDVHFVIPASSRRSREVFESTLRLHADGDLPLTVLFGHSQEALAAADLALVASDAAALEAVLFKTPMVAACRMATAIQWWSHRLTHQAYLSLPNRLAGERIVPELLQQQLTPWALAAALMTLMSDSQARRNQTARFGDIHQLLRQDNANKAAEAMLGLLEHARG